MNENDITYAIRGAIFTVYNSLGPGLLESAYEAALKHELLKIGLRVQTQVGFPLIYDNTTLGLAFRLDMLINDLVIIEIKSVETLAPVHHKQLLTYLKLANKRLGLLINFNEALLKNGIKRMLNGY